MSIKVWRNVTDACETVLVTVNGTQVRIIHSLTYGDWWVEIGNTIGTGDTRREAFEAARGYRRAAR